MKKVNFNSDKVNSLMKEFNGDLLFSEDAEIKYLHSANILFSTSTSEEAEENARMLLAHLRAERIQKTKIVLKYHDLRNLQELVDQEKKAEKQYLALPRQAKKKHKIQFPIRYTFTIYENLEKCQALTEQKEQEKHLFFKEEEIYSLAAHIAPPTELIPDISSFLIALKQNKTEVGKIAMNNLLAEKLSRITAKGIDGKVRPICEKEHGNFNSNIQPKTTAQYVVQCVKEILFISLEKEDEEKWIQSYSEALAKQIKSFNTLREKAAGQNTFCILSVLYNSLSYYKDAPLSFSSTSNNQIYSFETQRFNDLLNMISFSASIAKEAEVVESDDPNKMKRLADNILTKVDTSQAVIVPVGTPITPDNDHSEHAFYIVVKKTPANQYEMTIINGGYASDDHKLVKELVPNDSSKKQETGQLYTFNLSLSNKKDAIEYLSAALATEFHQLKDSTGNSDPDDLVLEHLRKNIYTDKYGLIQTKKETINLQFYGNCTLHNFNFAIKACFKLDTFSFSKFRHITLLGFEDLLNKNMKKENRMQRLVNKKKMLQHMDSPVKVWTGFFNEKIVQDDQENKESKQNKRVTAEFSPEELEKIKRELPECKIQ